MIQPDEIYGNLLIRYFSDLEDMLRTLKQHKIQIFLIFISISFAFLIEALISDPFDDLYFLSMAGAITALSLVCLKVYRQYKEEAE
ncbi:hypothetical protein MKS78_18665 [Acinetobacter baumannii]